MSRFRLAALAATGLGMALAVPAQAQSTWEEAGRDRDWHATGFVMAKADSRLPRIPDRIVTFSLPFERSYLASAAVTRVAIPAFEVPIPFTDARFRGNSLEFEAQAIKHFGRQDNAEVSAAAILRSGQVGIFGGLSGNVAWGNGFSYALGNPRQETGRGGVRGVDTVRFQYHMSFETELTDSSNPRLHYVVRLHHRSGIYGVISPSRTGSNYLGVGLRFDVGR